MTDDYRKRLAEALAGTCRAHQLGIHGPAGCPYCARRVEVAMGVRDETVQALSAQLADANATLTELAPLSLGVRAEAAEALLAQAREVLSDAADALADLGACDEGDCHEPNCGHVLPRVSNLLAAFEGRDS